MTGKDGKVLLQRHLWCPKVKGLRSEMSLYASI